MPDLHCYNSSLFAPYREYWSQETGNIVVDNVNVVEVSRQANYPVTWTPKQVVRKTKAPQTKTQELY